MPNSKCRGNGEINIVIIKQIPHFMSHTVTHSINSIFEQQKYPELWKKEYITPIQKVTPAEALKSLRPISGVLNIAKITDRILAEFMLDDMADSRDKQQYGNEKGMSLNHLLIKLLN